MPVNREPEDLFFITPQGRAYVVAIGKVKDDPDYYINDPEKLLNLLEEQYDESAKTAVIMERKQIANFYLQACNNFFDHQHQQIKLLGMFYLC